MYAQKHVKSFWINPIVKWVNIAQLDTLKVSFWELLGLIFRNYLIFRAIKFSIVTMCLVKFFKWYQKVKHSKYFV